MNEYTPVFDDVKNRLRKDSYRSYFGSLGADSWFRIVDSLGATKVLDWTEEFSRADQLQLALEGEDNE